MSRLARALARLARRAESAASGRGASPSAPIPRAGSSLARARERGTSPRFASARPWHSPRRASSSVAPPPDADASRLVEHDDDVDYARLAADRESSPASASSASSSSSAAAAAPPSASSPAPRSTAVDVSDAGDPDARFYGAPADYAGITVRGALKWPLRLDEVARLNPKLALLMGASAAHVAGANKNRRPLDPVLSGHGLRNDLQNNASDDEYADARSAAGGLLDPDDLDPSAMDEEELAILKMLREDERADAAERAGAMERHRERRRAENESERGGERGEEAEAGKIRSGGRKASRTSSLTAVEVRDAELARLASEKARRDIAAKWSAARDAGRFGDVLPKPGSTPGVTPRVYNALKRQLLEKADRKTMLKHASRDLTASALQRLRKDDLLRACEIVGLGEIAAPGSVTKPMVIEMLRAHFEEAEAHFAREFVREIVELDEEVARRRRRARREARRAEAEARTAAREEGEAAEARRAAEAAEAAAEAGRRFAARRRREPRPPRDERRARRAEAAARTARRLGEWTAADFADDRRSDPPGSEEATTAFGDDGASFGDDGDLVDAGWGEGSFDDLAADEADAGDASDASSSDASSDASDASGERQPYLKPFLPSEVADILVRAKGVDVVTMDVSAKCKWTEAFVVATAKSPRHVRVLAGAVLHAVKSRTPFVVGGRAKRPTIEGGDGPGGTGGDDHWMLVDCGSVVAHVFSAEARERYDLEGLWAPGERLEKRNWRTERHLTLDTIGGEGEREGEGEGEGEGEVEEGVAEAFEDEYVEPPGWEASLTDAEERKKRAAESKYV